jgi:hypothetical protein
MSIFSREGQQPGCHCIVAYQDESKKALIPRFPTGAKFCTLYKGYGVSSYLHVAAQVHV